MGGVSHDITPLVIEKIPAFVTDFPKTIDDMERLLNRNRIFIDRTKGINEWNHYYIRAINGEVRLWVNGKEVSGGTNCEPANGYLCLESEGAPIEFKNLRIRELP